jgi:peptidoglycan/xylan/chitin deacetylase (PgdA/CDA1 family)
MGMTHGKAIAAGLAAGGAVIQAAPGASAHVPALCRALRVRRRLDDASSVALTFDDGPHVRGTPAALESLRRQGARATFFLVGEQVRREPALAREIVAAGHTVAVHGQRHRNLLRLTPAQVRDDVRRGRATIADVTGQSPRLYRPPYGVLSGPGLRAARRERCEIVLWSRWGRDWRAAATAETIAADLLDAGPPRGDILLLHDADHYSAPGSWRATVAALPHILQAGSEGGLRWVAL